MIWASVPTISAGIVSNHKARPNNQTMAGALWAYYDNCYDDDDTESAQPDDLINADVFASVEAWESILPGQSSRERMLTMGNSLSRNRAKLQESILLESRKSQGRQLQQAML